MHAVTALQLQQNRVRRSTSGYLHRKQLPMPAAGQLPSACAWAPGKIELILVLLSYGKLTNSNVSSLLPEAHAHAWWVYHQSKDETLDATSRGEGLYPVPAVAFRQPGRVAAALPSADATQLKDSAHQYMSSCGSFGNHVRTPTCVCMVVTVGVRPCLAVSRP
jgi:hypothetical protein